MTTLYSIFLPLLFAVTVGRVYDATVPYSTPTMNGLAVTCNGSQPYSNAKYTLDQTHEDGLIVLRCSSDKTRNGQSVHYAQNSLLWWRLYDADTLRLHEVSGQCLYSRQHSTDVWLFATVPCVSLGDFE